MADKPQHTPGPWHYIHRGGALPYGIYNSPRGGAGAIALVGTEANARLIAEAPETAAKLEDLLEAAEWTLNIINGVGRGGNPVDPMDDEPEAAFDALRAAISKARGTE